MRRALFFGSGGFAVPVLEALLRAPRISVAGVVTTPPRPAGRRGDLAPTPVAACAFAHGIAVITPERLRAPDTLERLRSFGAEVGILSDYGRILPQAVLDLPALGILNLHPSLLPRHRGATPIPAAILAGDAETGVSLFRMDAGMDTGPLIASVRTPLDGTEDAPGLEARLAGLAGDLLLANLDGWLEGRLVAAAQPDDGVTLTRPLRREDGRLGAARSATDLERAVRAFRPWPGTFVETADGRLVVVEVSVARVPATAAVAPDAPVASEAPVAAEVSIAPDAPEAPEAPGSAAGPGGGVTGALATADAPGAAPGTLVALGHLPALVTVAGLLVLRVVRPAGGRDMPGDAWLRGRPRVLGTRVG